MSGAKFVSGSRLKGYVYKLPDGSLTTIVAPSTYMAEDILRSRGVSVEHDIR